VYKHINIHYTLNLLASKLLGSGHTCSSGLFVVGDALFCVQQVVSTIRAYFIFRLHLNEQGPSNYVASSRPRPIHNVHLAIMLHRYPCHHCGIGPIYPVVANGPLGPLDLDIGARGGEMGPAVRDGIVTTPLRVFG